MAIKTALTNTAKMNFLKGVHKENNRYKMALYSAKASLGPNTESYTPENEIEATGYSSGGMVLEGYAVKLGAAKDKKGVSTMVAFLDWDVDPKWNSATITARGALIYDDSAPGKPAIAVFDFGQEVKSTNGPFEVILPEANAENSLIRFT